MTGVEDRKTTSSDFVQQKSDFYSDDWLRLSIEYRMTLCYDKDTAMYCELIDPSVDDQRSSDKCVCSFAQMFNIED